MKNSFLLNCQIYVQNESATGMATVEALGTFSFWLIVDQLQLEFAQVSLWIDVFFLLLLSSRPPKENRSPSISNVE